MSDLAAFIADFNAELLNRSSGADGTAPDFKENVFTELMLEALADQVGIVENAVPTYFEGVVERGRSKINGYAMSDEEDSLDLFVSIFLNAAAPEKVAPDEVRKAIEQAVRYFRGAVGGLHRSLEPASDRYAMTARIAELGRRLTRVRVFVLTDGVTGMDRTSIPSRMVGDVELRFEVWDMERLSRAVAYGRPQQEIVIDLDELGGPIPCVALPDPEADYSAYLLIIPGAVLFRLYELYGSQLLERNVRSFLQANGKVNRGIRDTIRNEPHRFMAYNNGISITADAVETTILPSGEPAVRHIRGLQIVNGGQTSSSIHRAAKQDKANLSGVYVQAKLTVVAPELIDTLAPRIAEYANTQNPIQMADFSANDPFHIEVERLARQIWIPGEQGKWFYERARGQYLVAQASEGRTEAQARQFKERTPPHRKFGKLELGKYLNVWDQLPHQVSLGGQKNFVLFMQRLRETRPKTWQPDDAFYRDLIAKGLIFEATTRIVRREPFEGLRSQIVHYTVSALAFVSGEMLDLAHIWQAQRLSTELEEVIRGWTHRIDAALRETAGGRDVSEWCKKADCWKLVRQTTLELPERAPPEFAQSVRTAGGWGADPAEARVALSPDELDAMRQCRLIEPTDWIRIVEWGTRTGRLDSKGSAGSASTAAATAGASGRSICGSCARSRTSDDAPAPRTSDRDACGSSLGPGAARPCRCWRAFPAAGSSRDGAGPRVAGGGLAAMWASASAHSSPYLVMPKPRSARKLLRGGTPARNAATVVCSNSSYMPALSANPWVVRLRPTSSASEMVPGSAPRGAAGPGSATGGGGTSGGAAIAGSASLVAAAAVRAVAAMLGNASTRAAAGSARPTAAGLSGGSRSAGGGADRG